MCENVKKKDVWGMIDTFRISMNIGAGAGHADQVYYRHLCEGLQENNLDKLYEVIQATERGCGLRRDEKVCEIIQKAYREDAVRLGNMIADRRNLVDYWVLLSTACSTEMLIDFANLDTDDAVFYYECARLLMKRSGEETGCEAGIVAAVTRLANQDTDLWKRWIIHKENYPKWQQLYGKVLEHAGADALRIYAEVIHLDMPAKFLTDITESFQVIPDISKENIVKQIGPMIHKRWIKELEKQKEKKVYQDGILISAYTNIILISMLSEIATIEKWDEHFQTWVDAMERDVYAWHESVTQMRNSFFIHITQIYYLLCIREYCATDVHSQKTVQYMHKLQDMLKQYEDMWENTDEAGGNGKKELQAMLDQAIHFKGTAMATDL